jgi:2EXR family
MPPTNLPISLNQFTLFPKLPPELCLKVWKLDIESLEGQVVEFTWNDSEDRITAPAVDFALLKVNKESRTEVQKYFKAIETKDKGPLPLNLRPEIDILLLSNPLVSSTCKLRQIVTGFSKGNARDLKHLAIDVTAWT